MKINKESELCQTQLCVSQMRRQQSLWFDTGMLAFGIPKVSLPKCVRQTTSFVVPNLVLESCCFCRSFACFLK